MKSETQIEVDSLANMDLGELLDINLEDLPDLPEYKVYPAGTHKVTVSIILKDEALVVKLSAIETLELANPSDAPLVEGDETTVRFNLRNEFGVGKLKRALLPVAKELGCTSVADLANVSAVEMLATTFVNVDDRDKKAIKRYTEIASLQIPY